MIEHGTAGGTSVNTGCVPSKALLAAAPATCPGCGAPPDPELT
jgi:pyruvate/2-oxoglutarate dehydrogenase complex dihydrolipoamide dehydrogenase (E3) component